MIYRIDFKAMGCAMLAMVDSPSPQAASLLAQVPAWFEEWEQSLSRFRPESELSRLNRSASRPVQVSQVLWDVFESALDAEDASDGLVRATVLKALLNAGYDRSFEQMPAETQPPRAGGWTQVSSLFEVRANPSDRTICLPGDVSLDFGGIAKGWAAEQAAQRLSEAGPALVSAGGDIAISAGLTDGSLWPVTIDDPFHADESLTTLQLGACGVATSGTDYRRWRQAGGWNHHIIDPRSGQPACTDLVTATVVAPTAAQAEMAAKTVLILGSQAGLAWLEARPEFSALLVLESGQIVNTDTFEPFLWRS